MSDKSNGNGHEKTPLQSKKFIAFLIAELTWKTLAGLVLGWAWNADEIGFHAFLLLLAIIVVAAFVEIGYVLGQKELDKFVRLAQITGKVVTKSFTAGMDSPPQAPAPAPTKDDEEDKE